MTEHRPPQRPHRRQTRAVHGGTARSRFDETCEAIFFTSGFVYETAEDAEAAFNNTRPRYQYSRFGNPTVSMFESRMCELEGAAAARATSSGMAAVFASLMCQLKTGDRVVSSDALFGSCHYIIVEILPRFGIETVLVDGRDLDQWRKALSKPTAAVFLESPSNPQLRIVDIPAVCDLAHAAGARVIVDNVFATPLLQQPLQIGADVVVYSATKHIDGQGRTLGGIVLGSEDYILNRLQPFMRHTGPALSPMNAWLLLKGLETLEVRLDRMCASALRIAKFLGAHPKLSAAQYPGLPSHPQYELNRRQMSAGGSLVTFTVPGGKEGAFRALNALKLILISNNLGDSKSLVTHPATTTHQRLKPAERVALGIDDGLVRLSVGLEDPADLEDDLDQALKAL
ncbi:MAG: O-succinylhomoserine sulfhydrylase [Alphaproteobacteria bacterium]